MIEIALAVARWLQFAAAALLCGVPAFALYGLTSPAKDAQQSWIRRVLLFAVCIGLLGATLLLMAESAEMSGDTSAAFDPATVWAVTSGTHFGLVWIVRLALLLVAGAIGAIVQPMRGGTYALAASGAVVAGSLAWLGHGGDGGPSFGTLHLIGDVMHVLAASVWIGALVVLGRLRKGEPKDLLHGLKQFSGVGSFVVGTLVLTGILNTIALTAPRPVNEAIATPYALVLFVKVGLFAMMLALAALNRIVLTPRLSMLGMGYAETKAAVAALRRSILIETMLAVLVIVAVAALGVMEPPSAG